ncbi:hypothetical protein SAMN05660816_05789 [Niastella yeongjuensis]|nr:hypothetical protein SAMN05660816_05789 [Niastella yeongjuensis]
MYDVNLYICPGLTIPKCLKRPAVSEVDKYVKAIGSPTQKLV